MSDPGFTRPDLCSISAVDEQAELAGAARGLLSPEGYRLAGDDPSAPLARDVVGTLVDAGFMLRHCHRYRPRCRPGVCMVPVLAESGTGRSAIAIPWTSHDLQLDWHWHAPCTRNCQLVNAVPGSVPHAFRYLDRQRGSGGTRLMTGHRGQRTEAGR